MNKGVLMKSLRLWAYGTGLAVAAVLALASPQAFAKEGNGYRPIASACNLGMQISDFGTHVAAPPAFMRPADHSVIAYLMIGERQCSTSASWSGVRARLWSPVRFFAILR
jgi:hypothetical protein